jgi:hypothetical protein
MHNPAYFQAPHRYGEAPDQYGGAPGYGEWLEDVDDGGTPQWVHATSGEATYDSPFGDYDGFGHRGSSGHGSHGGYGGNNGFGGSGGNGYGFGGSGGGPLVVTGAGLGQQTDVDGAPGWRERARLVDPAPLLAGRPPPAATAVCFDDFYELLWVGRSDGFLQAFDLQVRQGN